jgi:hypothetical protein
MVVIIVVVCLHCIPRPFLDSFLDDAIFLSNMLNKTHHSLNNQAMGIWFDDTPSYRTSPQGS